MHTFKTLSLSAILLCNATPILSTDPKNPESNNANQAQAQAEDETNSTSQLPTYPNVWPTDNRLPLAPERPRPLSQVLANVPQVGRIISPYKSNDQSNNASK